MSSSLGFPAFVHCFRTLSLVAVAARPRALGDCVTTVAENVFLRKQLAQFQERMVRPGRAGNSTRWMMAALKSMVRMA